MIIVPLEITITCGESMGTPDDEHDNFGKMITLVKRRCHRRPMSELFGETDGMLGSYLLQDDSCTI